MNFHGNSWQNFILNYFLDVLEGFTFFSPPTCWDAVETLVLEYL